MPHRERIATVTGQQYRSKIDDLSRVYSVLTFNQDAASIAAYTFARLSKTEQKVLWKDLFIAATALAHKHGVVTQNRRHFELIAGRLPLNLVLRLAVWKP